jgi:hypothetical protein
MNEQIRLLSEQAHRSTADELAYLQRVHNRTYDLNESAAIYNEKFAQLIVRECAGLFPNVYVEIETEYGHTPVVAADYIKKHFGVER